MALALADTHPAPTAAVHAPPELTTCLASGGYLPPADLTLDTWLVHGRVLARRWATMLWAVADWARFGVDFYGPSAWPHLAAIAGRSRDALKRMVNASRQFSPHRRRLAVPFSRHVAVMALPEPVADRLLERSEREQWNQEDLVRQIRVCTGASRRGAR